MKNRDMEAPGKAAEREDRALDALRELDGICESDLWGYREGHPTYDKVQKVFALTPKPTGTEAGRGVVPAGWKLVPVEPTAEMQEAGSKAVRAVTLSTSLLIGGMRIPKHAADHLAAEAIKAAFAATPTPPVSPTPDSTGPAGAEPPEAPPCPMFTRYSSSTWTAGWKRGWRDAAVALTPSAPIADPVRDDGAREALAVIEFAQTIDDHYDMREFLKGWSEGDTSEWPEFAAFLASLPTPVSDVPGEAQTQEGGR